MTRIILLSISVLFSIESRGETTASRLGMQFVSFQSLGFEMQDTEVTRGQWHAIMGKFPRQSYPDPFGPFDCYQLDKYPLKDNPAACMTMSEILQFIAMMNASHDGYTYRLPSRDEWWNAIGYLKYDPSLGWCGDGDGDTSLIRPVRQLRAHNGLYDVLGNVNELTSSIGPEPGEDPGHPYYVALGSSAGVAKYNCRTSFVSGVPVGHRASAGTGFRLVRTRN